MTLNCLGPHNTRHSAPLSLSRGRRWNALESPEPEQGEWDCYSNSLFQIEHRSGIDCDRENPALSVHFIFLLAIWTLLMLGSDVSILIFTLRSCNTGTIVQLCWTQYYVNESSCPRDHILFKRNQYPQATRPNQPSIGIIFQALIRRS